MKLNLFDNKFKKSERSTNFFSLKVINWGTTGIIKINVVVDLKFGRLFRCHVRYHPERRHSQQYRHPVGPGWGSRGRGRALGWRALPGPPSPVGRGPSAVSARAVWVRARLLGRPAQLCRCIKVNDLTYNRWRPEEIATNYNDDVKTISKTCLFQKNRHNKWKYKNIYESTK